MADSADKGKTLALFFHLKSQKAIKTIHYNESITMGV
jgi:hypothetical protein